MKTEKLRNREEKEKFRIPQRVQDTIPIRTVWPDGTFLVGNNRYSRTYQFRDINYAVASNEDKDTMIRAYWGLLNSLDQNSTAKITIYNLRMNRGSAIRDGLMPYQDDGLDHYREEYNQNIIDQVNGEDAFCQNTPRSHERTFRTPGAFLPEWVRN